MLVETSRFIADELNRISYSERTAVSGHAAGDAVQYCQACRPAEKYTGAELSNMNYMEEVIIGSQAIIFNNSFINI